MSYIGETGTSFGQRAKEHMIQTMGGNYQISDPEQLKQGRDVIVWNGLWRKGTRDKTAEFLNRLPEFAPVIQEFVRTELVFTAALKADTRTRRRIEGALASYIKNQPFPAGSLLPSDVRYRIRKDSEPPITVQIQCEQVILGLPNLMDA